MIHHRPSYQLRVEGQNLIFRIKQHQSVSQYCLTSCLWLSAPGSLVPTEDDYTFIVTHCSLRECVARERAVLPLIQT